MTNRSVKNNEVRNGIKKDVDSNIMRLKREAEYLCRNEDETAVIYMRSSGVDNDDK